MKLALTIAGTPAPIPTTIAPLVNKNIGFGGGYFGFFYNLFVFFGIAAALLYIFYGGWRWVTSQGDPKEIKSARETIVWSLVGLLVMFSAILIVNFIGAFFGISFLGSTN